MEFLNSTALTYKLKNSGACENILAIATALEDLYGVVVFTGSRAIGWDKETSDWDLVIFRPGEDYFERRLMILTRWPKESAYYFAVSDWGSFEKDRQPYIQSLVCDLGDRAKQNVNLIVDYRGDDPAPRWEAATDYCLEHPDECELKSDRIAIFERFGAG